MNNKIVLNFKNIISELESKELKLCFVRKKYIFTEDAQGNLYQMEIYRVGSYLDQLIKDGVIVEFNLVDDIRSKNIEDWEKEIWGVSEARDFIERQCLNIKII